LCGRLWSRRSITGQWVWLSYILLAKKGEIRVLTFSKDLSSAWTEFRNCRISTVCSFLRWTRKVRKASSSLSRAWQLCNRSSTRTVSFCTWGLNSSFPSPIVAIRRARFLRACVLCSVGGYRVIFSRKPHPSTGLSERNPTLDNHKKSWPFSEYTIVPHNQLHSKQAYTPPFHPQRHNPTGEMPYLPTSQSWLHHSALLLQAQPTSVCLSLPSLPIRIPFPIHSIPHPFPPLPALPLPPFPHRTN